VGLRVRLPVTKFGARSKDKVVPMTLPPPILFSELIFLHRERPNRRLLPFPSEAPGPFSPCTGPQFQASLSSRERFESLLSRPVPDKERWLLLVGFYSFVNPSYSSASRLAAIRYTHRLGPFFSPPFFPPSDEGARELRPFQTVHSKPHSPPLRCFIFSVLPWPGTICGAPDESMISTTFLDVGRDPALVRVEEKFVFQSLNPLFPLAVSGVETSSGACCGRYDIVSSLCIFFI